MGQIRTHQVVPPSYDDIVLTHPDAKKITGIGRNFYRELGLKAFRTACTVTMASNFEDTMATLRRKITASLDDPKLHSIISFTPLSPISKYQFSGVPS